MELAVGEAFLFVQEEAFNAGQARVGLDGASLALPGTRSAKLARLLDGDKGWALEMAGIILQAKVCSPNGFACCAIVEGP